ncbi:GDP-mannose-dependent alpha-mannosyltransferase [[Brevibacterium] flavum]|uniref:GDP-mannose-dependent alpha-mannosyltransferase n=1 Tax=[Brevibacterium] flavum TaxID=92706 RepID=A0A0F6WPU5_9CORY|nr:MULTISPECIES: glycosyltransferase family 1 protein [Corynebacterium]AJE66520.1 GDP-mannose-dependent alpha-mannosyltransferase [Corynebacterium glutamicum]AKF26523.1 GDP-mannose-dependent alpha-mannosyltransferase [[Brevibacterium] flavum]AST19761.1 glycosyltransferase family 1 protein [Corynebacterium glutamicum ATCC 14067]KEI22217.1 GDP-mannose-dependent alpha-mannosyltransferase [Corynebacterium glutamicum ATCC 14067]KIH74494.1 GDP-mannose-dependent alpha-mannosyltransferase [Corynebacte
MRVAIVAESFLPNVNGVTNSVLRVLEHLKANGHDALVIAPGARDFEEEIGNYLGFEIVRVPTVRVPLIDSLPIGIPLPSVTSVLREYNPDIIHLASPFVLGGAAAFAARQLRIPAIAIYQTDVAGFSQRYHLAPLATASWEWIKTVHNMCQRTLAPSSMSIDELRDHGINDIFHWARGVDSKRFHPGKRSVALRKSWDPSGAKKIVGFVGRLASEKGVERLAGLSGRSDIQLVIVGDGPEAKYLQEMMPDAIFTGALGGEELATTYASLDLFVHPGEFETFCQAIQEAQASGVPTIGPRAGGPIDLINEGVNGLLLDVVDFKETLPAAAEWILDDSRHSEMCAAAWEGVKDKTWEALCTQLLQHYADVIALSQRIPLTFFGPSAEVAKLPLWVARALGVRTRISIEA